MTDTEKQTIDMLRKLEDLVITTRTLAYNIAPGTSMCCPKAPVGYTGIPKINEWNQSQSFIQTRDDYINDIRSLLTETNKDLNKIADLLKQRKE